MVGAVVILAGEGEDALVNVRAIYPLEAGVVVVALPEGGVCLIESVKVGDEAVGAGVVGTGG